MKAYISTYVFSLAGLTGSPSLNESKDYGIKKSKSLSLATRSLYEYLGKRIDLPSLEFSLKKLYYKVQTDIVISGYNPLSCIDFSLLNFELAKRNLSRARRVFNKSSHWNCFNDLGEALEKVETMLGGIEDDNNHLTA